ncbi:MAG: hypothetical protein AAF799_28205 [Myxococcota bacterium]
MLRLHRLLPLSGLLCFACVDRPAEEQGSGAASGGTGGDASTGLDGATSVADETGDPLECMAEPVPLWEPPTDVPEECEAFVGPGEYVPAVVLVTNTSDRTIHLTNSGGCTREHLAVSDAEGSWWPGDKCIPTCEGAMLDECGCLADCPIAATVSLSPGATYPLEWPGLLWEFTEMPDSCAAGMCEGLTECRAAIVPAPGTVDLMVSYGTQLECGNRGSCECEPEEDGWCINDAYPIEDSIVRVETPIEFPLDCTTVQLSIP